MSSGYPDILFRHPALGHSAEVQIELRFNGQTLPVAQAAGDRLIFDHPVHLPPGPAELTISTDGRPRHWLIELQPTTEPSRIIPVRTTG